MCWPRVSKEAPHAVRFRQADQRRFDGWLAEIEPRASGISSKRLLAHPLARTIVAGLSESSPYLFDLVRSDPSRLNLLGGDPEQHLET